MPRRQSIAKYRLMIPLTKSIGNLIEAELFLGLLLTQFHGNKAGMRVITSTINNLIPTQDSKLASSKNFFLLSHTTLMFVNVKVCLKF